MRSRVPVIYGVCHKEVRNGSTLVGEKVVAVRLRDFPSSLQHRLRAFFKGSTFNVSGRRGNMVLAGNPEIWQKNLQMRVDVERNDKGQYQALLIEDLRHEHQTARCSG